MFRILILKILLSQLFIKHSGTVQLFSLHQSINQLIERHSVVSVQLIADQI